MTNYKLHPDLTYKELNQFGFSYDGDNNKISIPVYYYQSKGKKIPQLFISIMVNLDEDFFTYQIVNKQGTSYPAYYTREYGKNSVVDIIDKNINNIINKLIKAKIIIANEEGDE